MKSPTRRVTDFLARVKSLTGSIRRFIRPEKWPTGPSGDSIRRFGHFIGPKKWPTRSVGDFVGVFGDFTGRAKCRTGSIGHFIRPFGRFMGRVGHFMRSFGHFMRLIPRAEWPPKAPKTPRMRPT
jgi:hypothetical protein